MRSTAASSRRSQALFDPVAPPAMPAPVIADKTVDLPAQNYYACVRNAAGTGCLPAAKPDPRDSGGADQRGGVPLPRASMPRRSTPR